MTPTAECPGAVPRDSSLHGKTALVTGAGRGIGKAIAIAFARAGCNVACVSRTKLEVEAIITLINLTGSPEAKTFVFDTSDVDAIPILIREIRGWIDRPVHILINNAGVARIEDVQHTRDMKAWQQIMATNLSGPVALSYEVLPDMLSSGEGVIMSIGSRNAIYNIPYMSAYSVSKTGLLRFHENLDREVAGKGVYNYYVVPGNVDTSILAGSDTIDYESFRHSHGARRMVEAIAKADKVSAEGFASVCVRLAMGEATGLSGRYIDTEGDLEAIFDDVRKGKDSKCLSKGLYKLKMDTL